MQEFIAVLEGHFSNYVGWSGLLIWRWILRMDDFGLLDLICWICLDFFSATGRLAGFRSFEIFFAVPKTTLNSTPLTTHFELVPTTYFSYSTSTPLTLLRFHATHTSPLPCHSHRSHRSHPLLFTSSLFTFYLFTSSLLPKMISQFRFDQIGILMQRAKYTPRV